MRLLLITVSLVALLAVCWLGWTHYAYQKMAKVMNSPEAKLVAAKFIPAPVKEIRRVNLGYGIVSLPASIVGSASNTTGNEIGIGADKPFYPIMFMPPGKAPDVSDLMLQLTGKSAGSWFELEKLALAAQPFSFLEMLTMGPHKAKTTVSLLVVKASESAAFSTTVQIVETNGVGAIVKILHDQKIAAIVHICDLRHDTLQTVFINKSMLGNLSEIVSALLSDYSMPLADDSDTAIKRLIDEAKIPPAPPRETEEPGALTPAR
jgi:hypothetical protein